MHKIPYILSETGEAYESVVFAAARMLLRAWRKRLLHESKQLYHAADRRLHGKAGEAAEEKSSASYVTASEIIRGLQSI